MASDESLEQRAVIKLCVSLGKTPTQTHNMMEGAKMKSNVSRALVFKWHKRFREGRNSLADDTGRGRKSGLDVTSIETVRNVVYQDRRYTVRDICDITGMSRGTVHRILTEHLNMRKLSARWVPRLLKEKRVSASRKFLQQYRKGGEDILSRIITTYETWMFLSDPETKEQSKQWTGDASPPPKKARQARSVGKQMYIFFMDRAGMILQHRVPVNTSINAEYYWKVLQRDLLRALRKKRPNLSLENILLHQDNAPSHTAKSTRLEISLLDFDLIEHAPYSPDMAPMDFHVFPVVKTALKGQKFELFYEFSVAVNNIVKDFDENWYKSVFDVWIKRHTKCLDLKGDYIVKY